MTALGMIGCGNWGANWVRTLASMAGVQLRWCCDLNEERLAQIRQQFPQVRTTTRVADVLADPVVAGLVMATPPATHFDLADRALAAGKHVLVEKPMTLASADALALTRRARALRRVLMVGHLLEYHPAIRFIQQLIARGELGEVQEIHSQRLNQASSHSQEDAWWSLAPHDISVAVRLLGSPRAVRCRGRWGLKQPTADVVFATLYFPNGRRAHMHVSQLHTHKTRKITVVGSKQTIVFDDTLPAGKVVIHSRGCRDTIVPALEATAPLLCEASHFIDCIRSHATPLSDGAAGARTVAVLEQGQRSLKTGRTIAIPPRNDLPIHRLARKRETMTRDELRCAALLPR